METAEAVRTKTRIWLPMGSAMVLFPLAAVAVSAATGPDAAGDGSRPPTTPIEIRPGGRLGTESRYRSAAEADNPRHVHFLYESRYVSEGRDNLGGHGLVSLASDLTYGNFTFAPWVARGLGSDYTELNLNFAYGLQLSERLDLYASYNHLRFWADDSPSNDNEIAAELVVDWPNVVETGLLGYYSFDAEGTFVELAVRRSEDLGPQWTLHAEAALGINFGYVNGGHEGLNNARANLTMTYHSAARTELSAYLAVSKAIEADRIRFPADATLQDLGWGGLGLIHHF